MTVLDELNGYFLSDPDPAEAYELLRKAHVELQRVKDAAPRSANVESYTLVLAVGPQGGCYVLKDRFGARGNVSSGEAHDRLNAAVTR